MRIHTAHRLASSKLAIGMRLTGLPRAISAEQETSRKRVPLGYSSLPSLDHCSPLLFNDSTRAAQLRACGSFSITTNAVDLCSTVLRKRNQEASGMRRAACGLA